MNTLEQIVETAETAAKAVWETPSVKSWGVEETANSVAGASDGGTGTS
jgi:hypothetical protein